MCALVGIRESPFIGTRFIALLFWVYPKVNVQFIPKKAGYCKGKVVYPLAM